MTKLKSLTPIEIALKEVIMDFYKNNNINRKNMVTVLGYLIARFKIK